MFIPTLSPGGGHPDWSRRSVASAAEQTTELEEAAFQGILVCPQSGTCGSGPSLGQWVTRAAVMHFLSTLPQEVWIIAAIAGAMILGFVQMLRVLMRGVGRLDFGKEYRKRFIDYANSQGTDRQAYQWLTLKAERMQGDMGNTGIYAGFRPPFEQVIYKNYPIVLNVLPRIRQMMDDNELGLWRQQIPEYVHAVDEALLRYLGSLEDSCAAARKELINPFRWFRAGISQVLSIPLYTLSLFGLMGARTIEAIQSATLFKFIAGLAGLVGFIGAVVGLMTGWSEAVTIVKGMWGG
jgi:hypothetical protein